MKRQCRNVKCHKVRVIYDSTIYVSVPKISGQLTNWLIDKSEPSTYFDTIWLDHKHDCKRAAAFSYAHSLSFNEITNVIYGRPKKKYVSLYS